MKEFDHVKKSMFEEAYNLGCYSGLLRAINYSKNFEDLIRVLKRAYGPGAECFWLPIVRDLQDNIGEPK